MLGSIVHDILDSSSEVVSTSWGFDLGSISEISVDNDEIKVAGNSAQNICVDYSS